MVRLDELPLLVMMKVFEDLSDPRDVDSVSRVCRLFNELITNHSNTLAKLVADKVDVHINYEQSTKAVLSIRATCRTKEKRLRRWKKTMRIEEVNAEDIIRCTRRVELSRSATVELMIMSAEIRLASCLNLLEAFTRSDGRQCSLKAPRNINFFRCKFGRCSVHDVINLNNAFVRGGIRNIAYFFCEHRSSSIMGIFWSNVHLLSEIRFTDHRMGISPTVFINCFVSAMMRPARTCQFVFLDLSMPLYTVEYLAYKFCSAGRIDYSLPNLTIFMTIADRPSNRTIRRLLERALGRAERERNEIFDPGDRTHHSITVLVTPFPIGTVLFRRLLLQK
uniref:F-box domain-containing protein n=1 Tax=Ascaris lumbricoides TaxID=6252 RepID=A0A9J2P508_ASCLU